MLDLRDGKRAEDGQLPRCRWCGELPMYNHTGPSDGDIATIWCDGGGGEKECHAYPMTSNGDFGHATVSIVMKQWEALNSI